LPSLLCLSFVFPLSFCRCARLAACFAFSCVLLVVLAVFCCFPASFWIWRGPGCLSLRHLTRGASGEKPKKSLKKENLQKICFSVSFSSPCYAGRLVTRFAGVAPVGPRGRSPGKRIARPAGWRSRPGECLARREPAAGRHSCPRTSDPAWKESSDR
jgi:hypothetical protein